MKFRFLLFFTLITINTYSQNDSLKKLNFTGYGEFYYSYDFSNPQNHEKSNFLYNHKRHNELNSNLIVAQANYLEKSTIEGKMFHSKDKIFENKSDNYSITTNMTIKL